MTMDSDDEKRVQKRNGKSKQEEDESRIDPDFQFDLSEDPYIELVQSDRLQDVVRKISVPVSIILFCHSTFVLLTYRRIRCP